MLRTNTRFAVILAAFVVASGAAVAEPVRRACLVSDRTAAAPRLCKCIQVAADATLTAREQSRAAAFFEEPHRAQEVRQSKDRSDGLFWERYKDFSALAEAFCRS